MPNYWGKQIFSLGSFPEVGQKQKAEKKKKERLKVCNNNGQLRSANATSGGACKATWAKMQKKVRQVKLRSNKMLLWTVVRFMLVVEGI